jgi:hypothetical protein
VRWIPRRNQRPPAQEPGSVEPEPASVEVAVTLWTASGSRQVEAVVPANTRLSDLLNDPSAGAMFDVPMDELLIVVPPAQPTDPTRRLHRPAQLVHLSIGPYEVSGSAHVPPGADAIAFLLRHGQRFVALRKATIEPVGGSADAPLWDVALVNLSMAHSTRSAGGTPLAGP